MNNYYYFEERVSIIRSINWYRVALVYTVFENDIFHQNNSLFFLISLRIRMKVTLHFCFHVIIITLDYFN